MTVLQLVKGSTLSDPESSAAYGSEHVKENNLNGIANSDTTQDFERADTTPNKGRKKVVIISPPNAKKRSTAIPTHNKFSVLASPPSPSSVLAASNSDGSILNDQYYIQSQNDLYQTSEWIKFLVPWGIGSLIMVLWQFCATFMCVMGVLAYDLIKTPRRAYVEIFEADREIVPDAD